MYTNERISHKFFFFLSVSMSTVITVLSVGVAVCLFCLVCILCCARRGANTNNRKKKHNFGVRKAAYFRVREWIKLCWTIQGQNKGENNFSLRRFMQALD